MINPTCDKCHKPLTEFGALVFSPPETYADGSFKRDVDKFHVCARCWPQLLFWMNHDLSELEGGHREFGHSENDEPEKCSNGRSNNAATSSGRGSQSAPGALA